MIAHRGQVDLLRARNLEIMAKVAIIHQLVVLFSRSDSMDGHCGIELGRIHHRVRDKLWRIVTSVILVDVVGRCDPFGSDNDLWREIPGSVFERALGLRL